MTTKNDLTGLQAAFVDYYLITLNATKAARLAGYKGSDETLAATGYKNLKHPKIAAAISERTRKLAMTADEVIFRLSQQARGNIGEFIGLSESGIATHPRSHLVKKFKCRRRTDKDGNIEEQIEIELHDAQSALVQLGRYHSLFTDRIQVDDWRSEAIEDIKAGRLNYQVLADLFDSDLATELFALAGVPISSKDDN